MKYKSGRNIVYSNKYHVVWCPKYRRSVLVGKIAERLGELLSATAEDLLAEMIEFEVMPDHVHVVVEVHPQFGIHRLVKRLKGRSSRVLRIEFPELRRKLPTLWTNSYFVSTVGGTTLETIKKYVENQKGI